LFASESFGGNNKNFCVDCEWPDFYYVLGNRQKRWDKLAPLPPSVQVSPVSQVFENGNILVVKTK
jgi:hypothetical protein